MKRTAQLAALTLAIAGLGLAGTASPASAAAACIVTVHPHTYPGVINDPYNGIGVETGEYHVHQTCIDPK